MKPFTKIASVLFAIVSIGHLIRLFLQTPVMIGNHQIPMWISFFGLIAPAIISWGLWKESSKAKLEKE